MGSHAIWDHHDCLRWHRTGLALIKSNANDAKNALLHDQPFVETYWSSSFTLQVSIVIALNIQGTHATSFMEV